jgi:aspartate/methionine/tyrosine aminotransferase
MSDSQEKPSAGSGAAAPQPSQRSSVDSFIVMDVMSAAARLEQEGFDITHMEVGQPGHPAPRVARQAAIRALEAGRVPYTEALGLPALRARIAQHYRDTYDVAVSPDRIVVTTGSSGGFILSFLSMFEVGDRVAIPMPGYPAYRNILKALGLVPVEIPTTAETRFVLSGEALRKAHAEAPLKGVLFMSPANPTGVVMSEAALQDVCDTVRELGIWCISDEIYHGLTYGAIKEQTALRFTSDAVIINSFSKFFCMTGWRIGWMVVPERLLRPIERLQQNLSISVPYLSQIAAHAAFDGVKEMEEVKKSYARNRALLIEGLPRIGLGRFMPMDGAFYVYIDVSEWTNDSRSFCADALQQAHVAFTPGLDFDPVEGHRTVRLSFAGTEADMKNTLSRLGAWLAAKGAAC